MMTSDFVTGRLGWNSSVISGDMLREAKGKGTKKSKKIKHKGLGITSKAGTAVSNLDNLVSSMESRETLPEAKGSKCKARGDGDGDGDGRRRSRAKGDGDGDGRRKIAKGDGDGNGDGDGDGRRKSKGAGGYLKKSKPMYDKTMSELDRIAMKYSLKPARHYAKKLTRS